MWNEHPNKNNRIDFVDVYAGECFGTGVLQFGKPAHNKVKYTELQTYRETVLFFVDIKRDGLF
jgi:hypothetical protein